MSAVSFLLENWFWSGLAAGSLIGLMWTFARGGRAAVDAPGAVRMINENGGVFLDIRAPAEFAKGHLTPGKNIPAADLEKRAAELEKFKEKPLVLVCANGMRAKQTAAKLSAQGFSQAYALSGGVAGWVEAQMPLAAGGKKRRA